MKKCLLFSVLTLLIGLSHEVMGQLSITTANTAVTQNFNGLPSTGTALPQSGGIFSSGWSFLETSTNANTTYDTGTGSVNSGNTYSYGVAGTGLVTDRALGMLQSGSLSSILGFKFTNNTGVTVTSLVIGYTGEVWRLSSATDNIAFSYQTSNVALNAASGWTTVGGLAFTTPVTGTAAAVDGNATANRTVNSPVTITGLSIANGTTVTLRWVDGTAGSSAGMGIDDFTITLVAATLPTVNLSVSSTTASEASPSAITVTATASAAVSGDQTVSLGISGTNITAGDYTLSGTTITIPSGSTTGSVTFTVVDDAIAEATETATLTISSPSSGITLGTTTTQNITITDNEPTVNLSVTSTTASEAAATVVTVTATASSAVSGDQTVTITPTGTATSGSDYTLSGTTITILSGATTGSVTFTVIDDALAEVTETATLTMGSPSAGISLGATTVQNITIADNEPTVGLTVSATNGTEAGATVITVTATASTAVNGDQTITLVPTGTATSGSDYTLSSTTITILNGTTTGTATFTVIDDAAVEGSETATLTISSPSSGILLGLPNNQSITIADNDFNAVISVSQSSFTGLTYSLGYGPSSFITYNLSGVALSPAAGDLTVTGSTAYEVSTDNVAFGNSATVAYTGSALAATPIYVRLKAGLSVASYNSQLITHTGGGATQVNVTMNGSVTRPSVVLSVSTTTATEAAGTVVTVTATASAPVFGNQTVDLAVSGTNITAGDYSLSNTVITIPDGGTVGTVTFTVLDDGLVESNETATLTISNPSANITIATATRSVTITAPAIVVSQATFTGISYVSGNGPSSAVTYNLSGTNLLPAAGNIVVTAPANYEISSDNITFTTSSLNVPYTSSTLAATPIYIRLQGGLAVGNYNSQIITNVGGGATSQNVTVSGSVSRSIISDVVAVAASESATVSSILNNTISAVTDGTQVWQFDIRDGGATLNDADNLATIVTAITLTQNGSNQVNDWNDAIQSIQLFDGSTLISSTINITTNQIQFTGLNINVADNSSKRISVRLTLQPLFNDSGSNTDGDDFVFNISNSNITTLSSGSTFTTFATASSANSQNIIDVIATQLAFVQQPTDVTTSNNMLPAVTVQGTDVNGNLDLNFTASVSLTSTGTMTGAPVSVNAVAGVATFSALVHTVGGTGLTLSTTAAGLTGATSTTFNVLETAVLNPGDLMFVAVNANNGNTCSPSTNGNDRVSMIAFKDITNGTTIDFTDNGWERANANKWGTGEGVWRLTRTGGTIPAGTLFELRISTTFSTSQSIMSGLGWTLTELVTGSNIALGNTGDQIFAMQGGTWTNTLTSNATYSGRVIAAFSTLTTWAANGNSDQSNIYPGLECLSFTNNRSGLDDQAFLVYEGAYTAATAAEWVARFATPTNWNTVGAVAPSSCGVWETRYAAQVPNYPISINATTTNTSTWTGANNSNWWNCKNWSLLTVPDSLTNVIVPSSATNDAIIDAAAAFSNRYNDIAKARNLNITGRKVQAQGSFTSRLHVYGDLTIGASGQLDMDDNDNNNLDGKLYLLGSWTNANAANFLEGNSTVIFAGNGSNQIITNTGGTSEQFFDLQLGQTQLPAGSYFSANTPLVTQATKFDVQRNVSLCKGTLNGSGFDIDLQGSWMIAGINPTYNPSTGTVSFLGTATTFLSYGGGFPTPLGNFNNIIINKPSANNLVLGMPLVINGNLTIDAPADQSDFNPNSQTITIKGNWINNKQAGNDGFLEAGSTVIFTNTAPSTIYAASGKENFATLEMNNTSYVESLSPVDVATRLTLTNGLFKSSSAGLLTLKNTATVSSPANLYGVTNIGKENSYVQGPMAWEWVGSTAERVFPTGYLGVYGPIAVMPRNNVDKTFTAEYFYYGYDATGNYPIDQTQTPPLDHVSGLEWWDVNCSLNTANDDDNAKIRLYWRGWSDVSSDPYAREGLKVAHFTGGVWKHEGFVFGTEVQMVNNVDQYWGSLRSNWFTSYSPVTLGTQFQFNALPVELVSFTATKENENNARLTWVTAQEQNSDYFEVQHSVDAINFTTIGTVNAQGNSTETHTYSFLDDNTLQGTHYYRLRQVDTDSSFTYSGIEALTFSIGANTLSIYPNPAHNNVIIALGTSFAETSSLEVFDQLGRQVMTRQLPAHTSKLDIDLSNLSEGYYIVRLTAGNTVLTQRLEKNKD